MNIPMRFAIFLVLAALAGAQQEYNDCSKRYAFDASQVGTVNSPFFGEKNYSSSLWCEYLIEAPEGYRIKITFKEFDVAPSTSCTQDQLTILRKDKATVLGKFCGSQLPNPILSYEGENEVWLKFVSDFMGSGKGFKVQYESSPYFTSVCNTGEIQCGNRNCFTEEDKCDGVDDCGDGTDEEDCGFPYETDPKSCGKQGIKPDTIFNKQSIGFDRMVGGEEVIPNSWPWQVSLQYVLNEPNGHFCGGTLINAQWVLTAAHCVTGTPNPGEIRIHFGAHTKFKKTKYELTRRSKKVIAYPDLEGNDIRRFDLIHDVALIKLNAPVKFSKGVQPACLPSQGWKAQPGWKCYVTGWGLTRGSGGADVLKQQLQVVQPAASCSTNENSQICVKQGKLSPCSGDSGGPINCRLDDTWYVFGAASYVVPNNLIKVPLCVGPRAIATYASAADKAKWIKTTINQYS